MNRAAILTFMTGILTLSAAAICTGCGSGISASRIDHLLRFSNFQAAAVVLGQPDFTTSSISPLDTPMGNPALTDGHLFVPSSVTLHNLAAFDPDAKTGDLPLFFLGGAGLTQTTFNAPSALATNGVHFAVADRSNNRVVMAPASPLSSWSATRVVGALNFTSAPTGCAQDDMEQVNGVAFGGSRLIVSATPQNRILIWNAVPGSNGANADLVLGKNAFTDCASPASPTAQSLNSPRGVWSDGKRLVVADTAHNRVLIWSTFPTQSGQTADIVLGQNDFDTGFSGDGPLEMNTPNSVASNGRMLAVADTDNHRVLIWNNFPTTSSVPPDVLLGQSEFGQSTPNSTGVTNQRGFDSPTGLLFDRDRLLVTDTGNHRILIFRGE